jgi:hypothetical protein
MPRDVVFLEMISQNEWKFAKLRAHQHFLAIIEAIVHF